MLIKLLFEQLFNPLFTNKLSLSISSINRIRNLAYILSQMQLKVALLRGCWGDFCKIYANLKCNFTLFKQYVNAFLYTK